MPITVDWFNDQQNIIYFEYSRPWTWEEFFEAVELSNEMADGLAYKVHHIYDISKSNYMPKGEIGQISRIRNNQHPNLGHRVLVTSNYFFRNFHHIMQHAYPNTGQNFTVVQSLDDALEHLETIEYEAVSKKGTVLCIEDNLMTLRLLQKNLDSMGYDVIAVPDARAGLDAVENYHPDAIVLDLDLPEMSGHDFAQIIKADPDFKHIPIFVLTANTSHQARDASFEYGCSAHLTKPISRSLFLETVAQIMAESNSDADAH